MPVHAIISRNFPLFLLFHVINILEIFSHGISFENPHWQRGTWTCTTEICQQPYPHIANEVFSNDTL